MYRSVAFKKREMLLGGLNAELCFNNQQEFYSNGDVITGYLKVNSGKPFTVRNIEVKLRCDEMAYVWVPNGQGGYYETETVRHLSIKRTLFPSRSVMDQSDKEARFTINGGEHKFDFEFRIPLSIKYPQTIFIENTTSGIRWYVKAAIHRGNVLSSTKRLIHGFEMRPRVPFDYIGTDMLTETAIVSMNAFLPGYSSQLKTAAGRIKELFPSNSQYRKQVEARVTIAVPSDGVLQAPSSLPVQIDVTSSDDDLLLISKFELLLKSKCIVRVNEGWNSAVHRASHTLLTLNLGQPFKQALETIQDSIFATNIHGRLPGSFENKHFDLSYKLVATVVLSSRENPHAVEKLRVTIPTVVNHTTLGPTNNIQDTIYAEEEFDEPPIYNEQPHVGELTFTNV